MQLGTAMTIALGAILFIWGARIGHVLLRRGATADDLFKSRNPLSLIFLGAYVCIMVIILNAPQMDVFPLEWRFHGMRITWSLMQMILAGVCGMALTVSWHTARTQVVAIALIGLMGIATFNGFENYLLSPIHANLLNNLQPNGVFKQTSNSSCAPAAMATVLRQWSIPATESGVAKLAATSRMGTSMPQLIVAAQELNMDGIELRPSWELMQQINRPGILAVWLVDEGRKLPHAVALVGMDEQQVAIADPADGTIFSLSREMFFQIWRDQYVPIFEPSDLYLSDIEISRYLRQLGYLQSWEPGQDLTNTIRRFQNDHHIKATGDRTPETMLALSGSFIQEAPRLDTFAWDTLSNGP